MLKFTLTSSLGILILLLESSLGEDDSGPLGALSVPSGVKVGPFFTPPALGVAVFLCHGLTFTFPCCCCACVFGWTPLEGFEVGESLESFFLGDDGALLPDATLS